MKKIRITKRDVLFFFIGFLTFFILETIFDWEGSKKSFKEGFDKGMGRELTQ